jgi:ATP-dependent Clp protease ATP-binding subunit ClpA
VELAFKCLAVTHTSGRVTLTPLELPHLAVHARTLEEAQFELTLALDDQISRSHPKHLWRYCRPGDGSLVDLEVELLPTGEKRLPLPLLALETPAHAGHTEARIFSANARYWFKVRGKDLAAQATALLAEQLKDIGPDALLHMRREGKALLVDLEIDVKPLRLPELKRKELCLDARPPPVPPEDAPKKEDDEEEDDDWDAPKRKKKPEPKEVATPTLNRLGLKWHELAKDFPATFGRDALAEQVRAHVTSKEPEPLLLLGPSGVGKTAVLHETARKLGKTTPFFFLDSPRLIAGQGFFGDWQRQTLDAFAEARSAKAVLHLGRLVDLLDAGKSAHSDDNVAQLIIPTLAGREVAVLAEATPEEWARVRDRHQSFARLFSPLAVDEPTPTEAQSILTRIADDEGKKRGVRTQPDALDEVRHLVRRFRPYGSQLGSSISFLRRLIDHAAHAKQPALGRYDVTRRFCVESGVPEELLRDDLQLDPAEVRAFLSARVKGQGAAVERVAQVVSVVKANLADPARPVATLFFAGPTGVGKTELSKALAERVFGSKDRLLRLDMGEFSGPDALARLIGGSGGEGHLAAAVRRQPFSIILLDEIEKAHPAVFDALLSVLGEGRLTDGRGRLADFRSTIIVMTSNLGADTLRAKVGFSDGADGDEGLRVHYLAEARRFFRPELFNRLDDVVVFSSLTRENLGLIVDRELKKVAARSGFQKLDVALALPPDVVSALAERGHEPRYGARPLKRVLERQLVAPAAAHLSAHRPPSASRLDVTLEGDRLAFAAHAVPRSSDGVSRAALLELCEQAAELRGEVRAWLRAPLLAELRQTLQMFERLSREPSYWLDRPLADEQSRKAGMARELIDAFERLRGQAEAAEELIFEAYCSRAGGASAELSSGLDAARDAFEPLTERLFACLYPPIQAATLTLLPGKGAQRWALWLADVYRRWAEKRKLSHELRYLVPKTPEQLKEERAELERNKKTRRTSGQELERVLQQQGVIAAIKLHREKTGASLVDSKAFVERVAAALKQTEPDPHAWRAEPPQGGQGWVAVALTVLGADLPMLLSAEHGAHRIHDAGDAFAVKVRFQPGNIRAKELGTLEQLEVVMPGTEIRRIWPVRKGQEYGLLKDLRTHTEHRATYGGFELGQVLAAWVRFRVFGAQEPAWT